jgi:hypothetical protein
MATMESVMYVQIGLYCLRPGNYQYVNVLALVLLCFTAQTHPMSLV